LALDPNIKRLYLFHFYNSLALAALTAMVVSFLTPYFLEHQHMTIAEITVIMAVVSVGGGYFLMVLWGKLADRYGGRNVMRLTCWGMAGGLFCLLGDGRGWVWAFAALAGIAEGGLFGAGIFVGQRYLTLSLANEQKVHIYLGAIAFVQGCGALVGALAGGYIIEALGARMAHSGTGAHLQISFAGCACGYLLLGQLLGAVVDGHKHLSSGELATEIYRIGKTIATRGR